MMFFLLYICWLIRKNDFFIMGCGLGLREFNWWFYVVFRGGCWNYCFLDCFVECNNLFEENI